MVVLLSGCAELGNQVFGSSEELPTPSITVRIGVDADLPQFATLDKATKEYSGFEVELLREIGRVAGFNVDFANISYLPLMSYLEQCRLDAGIAAITVQDELLPLVDFSDPYYTTSQVVVVKEGNILITGRDSLAGMLVSTQAGSLSEKEMLKIPGIKTKFNDTYNSAFTELIAAYLDAVVADKPHAWKYVNSKPNNLKIVGEEFGSVSYAVAVCKDRPDVLAMINSGLAQLKENGTLDRLVKKWIVGLK